MDETPNTISHEPSRENPHELPKAQPHKTETPKTEGSKTEGPKTTAGESTTPLSRLEYMRRSLGAEHPDTLMK